MDGRLPGVDDESPEQVICHVDMDCFYAACGNCHAQFPYLSSGRFA
ncbi:hypothetical protein [Halorientalis sp. IM1011]|nr:hypothetical protein [Halorientalis sp. IM1011]